MQRQIQSEDSGPALPRLSFSAVLLAGAATAWLLAPSVRSPLLSPNWAPFYIASATLLTAAVSYTTARIAFPFFDACPDEQVAPRAMSCGAIAAWLVPVGFLLQRQSLWSIPLAILFGAAAARLLWNCAESVEETFTSASPSIAALARAASFTLQAAMVFVLVAQLLFAALMAAAGAFLIAFASAPLSLLRPLAQSKRKALIHLSAASILTWLVLIPQTPFHVTLAGPASSGASTGSSPSSRDLFSGVILLAPTPAHLKLSTPILKSRTHHQAQRAQQPIVIQFSGVYWILTIPHSRPPASSLLVRDSPLSYSFNAPDRTALVVQAHQQLPFVLYPACCEALEIAVSNQDPQPNTIKLHAYLATPDLLRSRRLALGSRGLPPNPNAVVRFPIPAFGSTAKFDRVVIDFDLSGLRQHISPKVAIQTITFIPRSD